MHSGCGEDHVLETGRKSSAERLYHCGNCWPRIEIHRTYRCRWVLLPIYSIRSPIWGWRGFTLAGATANAILTSAPDVYLYGCLIEAAIFTQDQNGAVSYLQAYNASVAGLNARTYGPPGLEADIAFCAQVNLLDVVPRFARMVGAAAEIVLPERAKTDT